MPGENCVIYGCSASRRNKGISFFKVPLPSNEFNKKWGSELINIITKDREIDTSLKTRIDSRTLFICKQHFTSDQYYQYDSRKSLKEGELPMFNLPTKSVSKPTDSRSTLSIQKRDEYLVMQELSPPPSPSPFMYKNFNDFTQRIVKFCLGDCWEIKIQSTLAIITCITNNYVLPKFDICVDKSLPFSVRVFGWMLPEDRDLYSMYGRSFLNVTLSNFIQLKEFILCDSINVHYCGKELICQKHFTKMI